jgi:hypothetical protein
MAKKLLITGGCSYTDPNYLTNDKNLSQVRSAWKMWPEYLGKALELEVVNTGVSGSSNETILHNLLEKLYLYKDRVDTVAVMWTGMDRRRIMCGYDINPISETNIVMGTNPAYDEDDEGPFGWAARLGMKNLSYNFITSEDFHKVKYPFVKYCMQDSLRAYNILADICKAFDIKFIFMNALLPFDYFYLNKFAEEGILKYPKGKDAVTLESQVFKDYMNNIWFSRIDKNYKKHFIGWPIFPKLGGSHVDDMRYNGKYGFDENNNYNVSEVDRHPNCEAQEIISRIFIERYRKIYD